MQFEIGASNGIASVAFQQWDTYRIPIASGSQFVQIYLIQKRSCNPGIKCLYLKLTGKTMKDMRGG